MTALQDTVKMMLDKMQGWEKIMTKLSANGLQAPHSSEDDDMYVRGTRQYSASEEARTLQGDYHLQESTAPPQERSSMDMMAEDEAEADPGPPVAPGEPAIPINHTTLAGLLLEWPSIRDFTQKHLHREGIRHPHEYPISQEQNRGLLIVYGRGEYSSFSRVSRDLQEQTQASIPDDLSDTTSPSPAADFGHLGGMSPSDGSEVYKSAVLASDGNPDFQEEKVWSYVASFKEHILNMHPIIQPRVLHDWVQHFLDALPKSNAARSQRNMHVANVGFAHEPTGSKRKRSPEAEGSEGQSPGHARGARPERTIHNALILIILALGKICQARDRVCDAVHPSEAPVPHGSPQTRNGVPSSPSHSSPPSIASHGQTPILASPTEHDRGMHSRRSSIHGSSSLRPGYTLKKNYEAIPGLEYFAFATDILGNHIGGYTSMKNVYALIFAGLFHGQLARPMESFAFIHQAGHKLQVIMRPSLDKLRRIKHGTEFITESRHNQLALAFWTCLQLESDLIAELQVPPSGLLSYEDDMPHPNMSLLEGFDQRILDSYPGQLYLRTHLNSIHRMFYAPDKEGVDQGKKDQKFNNVGLVVDFVKSMHWVAKSFQFKESDAPADDILSARLRAKYWGAQVITYRPFIRQILMWSDMLNNHPSSPKMCAVSEFRQGVTAPIINPAARSAKDLHPDLLRYAELGVKALVESTRAFHNLGPKRPIITNVFGTAHA